MTPGPAGSASLPQSGKSNKTGVVDSAAPGTAKPQAESTTRAKPVELKVLDYDGIKSLIASHKGKVVVMDVWATTCPPCIKEFPGLVALDRKHGDQVACISVSNDFLALPGEKPEDHHDEVLTFLEKQGATFDNVLSSTPDSDLYGKLDFPSIPAVFVYGPDGTLLKQFGKEGEYTYAKDVTPFVEQLLAQNAS